jgi:hypothetical protein
MNIIESIFKNEASKDVLNPISQLEGECKLMNTKKEKYYTHVYDARPILSKLRDELKVSEEIISNFDLPIEPRQNCCNAVSIMLYLIKKTQTPYGDIANINDMNKYLNSVNRSVKNADRKLPDWLVRIYMDKSVYECMEIIKKLKNDNIDIYLRSQELYDNIIIIFEEIITSPNVEIYTFDCKSFYVDGKIKENIRSLRFLVLIDPTVNICAIREADGYMTNLDCHNLKIFSNSNRLFYLLSTRGANIELIKDSGNSYDYNRFNSYASWLRIYKSTIRNEFFNDHQNIYDMLAGVFTTKLKLKPEFYFSRSRELFDKIQAISNITQQEFEEKYDSHKQYSIESLLRNLYQGFDEIFLLDIYKEITSLKIFNEKGKISYEEGEIKQLKDSLFYATNILNLIYTYYGDIPTIVQDLKDKQIIPQSFDVTKLEPKIESNEFDAYILKDIIYNDIFDIKLDNINISYYSNIPYGIYQDSPYDFQKKYLKYKQKYLMLKNKI